MSSEQQLSVVLSEFALTLVSDDPIQGILERLVGRIVEILPISAAGVTLIARGSEPRDVAASNEAALRYEKLQTELDEGPCLAAYHSGKAVAVPDLADDERFEIFGPRAVEAGLAAVFAFPLRQGDTRFGALDLYRDTPGPLDRADMAAAQTLADVTAAYVVNAKHREDLRLTSEQAYFSAVHDALTGLPNRTLLLERIGHALQRGMRSGQLAVLFTDLDGFKAVNDLHGHGVGDELLVAAAERLTALLRPGDTLARLAGDEFVILCEDLDDDAQAEAIAARVAEALALPFELGEVVVRISGSVGIAVSQGGQDIPERLIDAADVAMYQAKRKGGGRHQSVDLHERHLDDERADLMRDLRLAVDRGQLRTEYQPIVATRDGRTVAVEAVLRWEHPTKGAIEPHVMVGIAERAGLITDVGQWVLERACEDRRSWVGGAEDGGLEMTVDVSAHQLLSKDYTTTVANVLARTGTPARLLTLEIDERAVISDTERARVVLHELKEVGVVLAFDQFGSGCSSLGYLHQLPLDAIKIGQALTAKLCEERTMHAIVATSIELAHLLGLSVVVDGVETAAQHHEIAALAGERCQGDHFAGSMSADALTRLTGGDPGGFVFPAPGTTEPAS